MYKVDDKQDRMFCYLWSRNDQECKFGEHFVKRGADPMTSCLKRVYNSMDVQKRIDFPVAQERGIQIWDVSALAESVGRNHKQSHMDDYLRKQIGFRVHRTEFHNLPQDVMSLKVCELLAKYDQPLLEAGLSTDQHQQAEAVIDAYNNGSRTMLAELCARFGKTIWSGAIATETEQELVVVASYVKTVFTSFANDIARFEQFRDYVHVDTGEEGYEKKIRNAFKDGKKVFAYLSMCGGSERQNRIDFLFSLRKKRMMIIDEADLGIHKKNQSAPLQQARKKSDLVLIMTGTNADRAIADWGVDYMTCKTYAELLVSKARA